MWITGKPYHCHGLCKEGNAMSAAAASLCWRGNQLPKNFILCQATRLDTLTPRMFHQHGHPYTPLHCDHTLSYSTLTPPLNAIICYPTAPQLCYRTPYYSTTTRDLKNIMDCVCFCHLLQTLHCCLCPNGRCNPRWATHPPLFPHIGPPTITRHLSYYNNCEKVAQNPAGLAMQLAKIVIKH